MVKIRAHRVVVPLVLTFGWVEGCDASSGSNGPSSTSVLCNACMTDSDCTAGATCAMFAAGDHKCAASDITTQCCTPGATPGTQHCEYHYAGSTSACPMTYSRRVCDSYCGFLCDATEVNLCDNVSD